MLKSLSLACVGDQSRLLPETGLVMSGSRLTFERCWGLNEAIKTAHPQTWSS